MPLILRLAIGWLASFLEDRDGSTSSKKLQAVAAMAFALGVIAALTGVACWLVQSVSKDPARALEALRSLLTTIELLTAMTLGGGAVTYLGGKHIETRKPKEEPAA